MAAWRAPGSPSTRPGPAPGDTRVHLGVVARYRDWDVVHAGPGALQAGQLHLEGEAGHLQGRGRRWVFPEDICHRLSSEVYRGFLGEFHLHAPGRGRAGLQASQGLRQLVGYLQYKIDTMLTPGTCSAMYIKLSPGTCSMQCTPYCHQVPAACNLNYNINSYLLHTMYTIPSSKTFSQKCYQVAAV